MALPSRNDTPPMFSSLTFIAVLFASSQGLSFNGNGRTARIISFSPSITELLFALGAQDQIVGLSRYADWPMAAQHKPKLGGPMDPDLERMSTLGADVILSIPSQHLQHALEPLLGSTLELALVKLESLDDLIGLCRKLGAWLGRMDRASELIQSWVDMRAEIEFCAQGLALPQDQAALWLISSKPIILAGQKTPYADLSALLHHHHWPQKPGFPVFDVESLVANPPALVMDMTGGEAMARLKSYLGNAVILNAKDDRLFRVGPRTLEALLQQCKTLKLKRASR